MIVGTFPAALRARALLEVVALEFDRRPVELVSASRIKPAVRARFGFAWVAMKGLPITVSALGRLLGGRDHSTILHAVRRGEQLRQTDADFRERTDRLLAALEQRERAGNA